MAALGVFLITFLVLLDCLFSMPYIVPLQGKQGGKRTLVLLDKISNKFTFSMFFDDIAGVSFT
jgi:hypothetical protein